MVIIKLLAIPKHINMSSTSTEPHTDSDSDSDYDLANEEDFEEDEEELDAFNNTLQTFLEEDPDEYQDQDLNQNQHQDQDQDQDQDQATSHKILMSSASLNASANWEAEAEMVRSIYDKRIIDNSNEKGNRYFSMRFVAAQFQDLREEEIKRLKEELHRHTYNWECQVKYHAYLLSTDRGDRALEVEKKRDSLKKEVDSAQKALDREIMGDQYPYLQVTFRLTRRYPSVPLDLRIDGYGRLDGPQIANLYRHTSKVMRNLLGTPMICATIDAVQEKYDEYLPKEADRLERLEREHTEEIEREKAAIRASPGIDLNNPGSYVGDLTPLLRRLSETVSVINVENVLRADLVYRFERYRKYLQRKYLEGGANRYRRTDRETNKWTEIQVSYHGTRAENVGNIVKTGLQVPSTDPNAKVKVASGSRYGLGIYTSPKINFSLHYTRGTGRLLVVATLPGRRFMCNDSNVSYGGGCKSGYDSHQSHDGTELVLFKAAQVLPCYVIHYKHTSHLADKPWIERGMQLADDPVVNWKLKKKLKQEELRAQAMKTLGYGFGPAGSKFVVEAIIPEREIPEEYSSFQNTHEHQYQYDRGL